MIKVNTSNGIVHPTLRKILFIAVMPEEVINENFKITLLG
jgi:hypothetical protein